MTFDRNPDALNKLIISYFPASQTVAALATALDTTGTILSNAGLTSFSPFTLGSLMGLNPLPLNDIRLNVRKNKDYITLSWSVYQPKIGDYYEIQRSKNGVDFITFDQIKSTNFGNKFTVNDDHIYKLYF